MLYQKICDFWSGLKHSWYRAWKFAVLLNNKFVDCGGTQLEPKKHTKSYTSPCQILTPYWFVKWWLQLLDQLSSILYTFFPVVIKILNILQKQIKQTFRSPRITKWCILPNRKEIWISYFASVFMIFLLDFGIALTVWYVLFWLWYVLFWLCGMSCFDCVICLDLTVWYVLFD